MYETDDKHDSSSSGAGDGAPTSPLMGGVVDSTGEAVELSPAERLVPSDSDDSFSARHEIPRRRLRLPVILFLLTCVSTFLAGSTNYYPVFYLVNNEFELRRMLLVNWQSGLTYMGCVMGILFAHEMGHFLATVRYRIPASYPFFLPFPITPMGTLGAVIGMDGMRANRKEIFDIGIAGPLAGLVVAGPVLWIGVQELNFTVPELTPSLEIPLAIRLMLDHIQPPGYSDSIHRIGFSQLNPYLMAGWVGLLVTGLNMLPVGQLDGGHVSYTLFGRIAHWMARLFVVFAIAAATYLESFPLAVLCALLLLVGSDHPPTNDDSAKLGKFRTVLGFACIFLPLICLPLPPFISLD